MSNQEMRADKFYSSAHFLLGKMWSSINGSLGAENLVYSLNLSLHIRVAAWESTDKIVEVFLLQQKFSFIAIIDNFFFFA